MNLFELDDTYTVQFNPEVFLLKDFAELKKSRKKDIELLYKEMSYIYFFTDLRSDFQFQTDKKERAEEVKKMVGLKEDWKPDDKINTCIEVYKYLSTTTASRLLESAYTAVDKIVQQNNTIDLNERNLKTNTPIWNQKHIQDSIKGIPELLKSLRVAEAEYLKGQQENEKLKGDKMKTLFEDGFRAISE